jgi:hypothetical protein
MRLRVASAERPARQWVRHPTAVHEEAAQQKDLWQELAHLEADF